MTDDEHYTDVDISDIIDDTEQFADVENVSTEIIDTEVADTSPNVILINPDQICIEKKPQVLNKTEATKFTRLPMARIKNIMKMDPDVHLVNAEAVFLVTKATELFLETIAKESFTAKKKGKTITKKDVDHVINTIDCLCFLEGAMDF